MRFLFLSSLLLLSTSLSLPAFAEGDAPTSADIKNAAASYDQGRERFREESYIEAAEKFEAADDYAPSAAALRLAIAARKEAGQSDRAATLAALALARYPEDAQLAEEAQAVIDEFGPELAKINVTCDSACELLLNDKLVHGQAAEMRTVYMEPGSATLRASWSDDRTQSESVDVEAGDEKEVSFYAPALPERPSESDPDVSPSFSSSDLTPETDSSSESEGWHPAVFWTGVGLTVAGGALTTVFGLRARSTPGAQSVVDNCVQGDQSCSEYKVGRKNQLMTNVSGGATAALGVFTIVSAFLTDWGGENETASLGDRNLSIRPTFAVGDGAFLGATGTF